MRTLIQRVKEASVRIDGTLKAEIGTGMLILLGIEEADNEEDIEWLCHKIANLRIFADEQGIMNKPIAEVGGKIIVVSQFTLFASTKKGNRPSYIRSARPETALPLYKTFLKSLSHKLGEEVQSGEFGADMQISLTNDGPVTIWIDSKNRE